MTIKGEHVKDGEVGKKIEIAWVLDGIIEELNQHQQSSIARCLVYEKYKTLFKLLVVIRYKKIKEGMKSSLLAMFSLR